MKVFFNDEEQIRYQRQFSLSEVGVGGQQKLKSAKVLCVGAGGLGSPALLYLAGAGIGTLGIVDDDQVELSNLHRQLIYTTDNLGKNKVNAAKAKLNAINPNVNVITYAEPISKTNALNIISLYDAVIDGTDNFTAKYLINDACCFLRKPNVYASIHQFQGQCSVFSTAGPCYRCLHPNYPKGHIPNCAQAGVLGALPGLLGTIQAIETIKLILNIGDSLQGKLLTIDALSMEFRQFKLKQNTSCKACGVDCQAIELIRECDDIGMQHNLIQAISTNELKEKIQNNKNLTLLDVREPYEHQMQNIGGKLIPLKQLQDRFMELDISRETIIYCQLDTRSKAAAEILIKLGFKKVLYLKGGLTSWAANTQTTLTGMKKTSILGHN